MSMQPMTDLGAHTLANEGFAKPQTAADATAVVGAIVDRQGYDSALVIAAVAFTSASGASGAKNTLSLQCFHDSAAAMGSESALKSDSYVYTWANDGANSGVHVLPVDLQSAERYIRGKATLTESGTITISAQSVAIVVVLGGAQVAPPSGYAAAGYESTTEPSA